MHFFLLSTPEFLSAFYFLVHDLKNYQNFFGVVQSLHKIILSPQLFVRHALQIVFLCFSFFVAVLKALDTRLFCHFCFYSIYCDNKYYVKTQINLLQDIICLDNVFILFVPLCRCSCSGFGFGFSASHWLFIVLLFLQHKPQKLCNCCVLRVFYI